MSGLTETDKPEETQRDGTEMGSEGKSFALQIGDGILFKKCVGNYWDTTMGVVIWMWDDKLLASNQNGVCREMPFTDVLEVYRDNVLVHESSENVEICMYVG